MKKNWILTMIAFVVVCVISSFTIMKTMTAEITLKTILLDQLKKTHNNKDWFVPANIAVEGLTAEQAMMKDNSGNHSVGQLAYHLVFWNERQLMSFKGIKPPAFSGNNDETFNAFDKKTWDETVTKLDKVMTDIETLVEGASEAQLKEWSGSLTNIATHNAYHTGQIIYVRKQNGNWNPEKGVK